MYFPFKFIFKSLRHNLLFKMPSIKKYSKLIEINIKQTDRLEKLDIKELMGRTKRLHLEVILRGEDIHIKGPAFYAEGNSKTGYFIFVDNKRMTHTSIGNTIRIVSAVEILNYTGIMLHSSSFKTQDGGLLLFGHSGSGKTTTTKIVKEFIPLHDDISFLFLYKDNVFLAPIFDAINRWQIIPCKYAFFLKKANYNKLKIDASKNIPLKALSCAPFIDIDKRLTVLAFNNIKKIFEKLFIGELYFSKNGGFEKEIEDKKRSYLQKVL